jgi:hypothetical protein
MLVQPDLDRRVLAATLGRQYGLVARRLRFVPAGETAWCSRLTDDRGGRWFLKLARPGAITPARAEFALELAGALAELGLPVPRPRPTRSGRRWCRLDGLRLAVFELVDGDPPRRPGPGRPGHGRAGRPAGRDHPRRHPALGVAVPFVERFEVAAALAPREADLALFTGPGFERFLAAYEGHAGPSDLDPDLLAFLLLRRNLDDLADWLGAALDTDRPDPQRRADLHGVRWCLARRPTLEARIAHTRRLLAGRR